MLRLVTTLIILSSFANVSAGDEFQPPDPPEGFNWKNLKEIGAFFLIPKGWFFQYDHVKEYPNVHAYFLSKEKIKNEETWYLTGLSINVNKRDFDGDTLSAKAGALTFLRNFAKGTKRLRGWELPTLGAFRGYGIEVTKKFPDDTVLHMVHLAFVSIKTNTFYTVLFETPEGNWKQQEINAQMILGGYLVDDDI